MPIDDRAPTLNVEVAAADGDKARAETDIPLGADALFEFVSDLERLFRLNPHLEIEAWLSTPDGFRLTALNETNACRIETQVRLEVELGKRNIAIYYENGLKRLTTIAVEPHANGVGSRLVVVEHYPTIDDPQDSRVAEVDRSLVPWVAAVRRHLSQRARWGSFPGWRWWNEKFMLGMPPRQRRIVRLIVWASFFEFLIFLALVVVLYVSL